MYLWFIGSWRDPINIIEYSEVIALWLLILSSLFVFFNNLANMVNHPDT